MLEIVLPDKNLLKPCFGVDRAIKKCLKLKNKEKYVIYGQLAHNRRLVKKVEESGLVSVDNLDRDSDIIIRAHGIDKNDKEKLKNYIDLTCPFVLIFKEKALKYQKLGYQIVIIGDKNHIEVKNIVSYLKNPIIIRAKEEALKLPFFKKIACMSQTTERQKIISQLIPTLETKTKKFIYIETRCNETKNRQETTQKIAKKVDLLIIAGDSHSANANNLLKIGLLHTKTILINSGEKLKKRDLSKIKKVGIIASASTPYFIVKEIVRTIKSQSNLDERA